MGLSHRKRRVGRPRTRDHRKVTSSAPQRRADDANGESALDKNSPRFYEDDRVSRRAVEWAEDPSTFFGDVTQGCIACRLYKRIQAVSSDERSRRPFPSRGSKQLPEQTVIDTIELRICMVLFHLLRTKFSELFYAGGNTNPLTAYLSAHRFEGREELSSIFTNLAKRSSCYHELTQKTAHRGVLLLWTSFGITELESKKNLEFVSGVAATDIKGISAMELYDAATKGIFDTFEASLRNWRENMAQWVGLGERTPVQPLIDILQGQNSTHWSPPCAKHNETPLATGSEFLFPIQEVLSTIQQTATVAEDVHGAECHFDPSVILLVPDMSGVIREVTVGALARGSNTHGLTAGTQSNSTYPPSSHVSNHSVYTALQWTDFPG